MISLYGEICVSWYDMVCIWVLAHHWQWNEETIQRYLTVKKLALISQIGLECILYYNLYASDNDNDNENMFITIDVHIYKIQDARYQYTEDKHQTLFFLW